MSTIPLAGRALALAFLLLPLAACGGDDAAPVTTTDSPTTPDAVVAPSDLPAAPAGAVAEVVDGTVTISPVGDEMRFAETEFTVTAGQEVRLVMDNVATSVAMQHNVVILVMGADVNAFGQAAMSAADTDYVPSAMTDQVVAHTPMSQPGQSTEVTFTAPTEPGDYTYICTFPGHFTVMQGVMHVVAA